MSWTRDEFAAKRRDDARAEIIYLGQALETGLLIANGAGLLCAIGFLSSNSSDQGRYLAILKLATWPCCLFFMGIIFSFIYVLTSLLYSMSEKDLMEDILLGKITGVEQTQAWLRKMKGRRAICAALIFISAGLFFSGVFVGASGLEALAAISSPLKH